MTSHQSSRGIPFPQSQTQTASPTGLWRNMDDRQDTHAASRSGGDVHRTATNAPLTALAPPPSPPYHRGQYHGRGHSALSAIRTDNGSPVSGSSSRPSGGLPSIRNLLNSIGHEDYANGRTSHHAEEGSAAHAGIGAPNTAAPHGLPVRSLSPSKRPPIAPSAFAHSQYPTGYHHHHTGRATFGHAAADQTGSNVKRSPPSLSHPAPPPEARSTQSFGVRHAQMPAPLLLSNDAGRHDSMESGGLVQSSIKRAMHARSDLDEVPLSPASLRRRHTVGALDEPMSVAFEGIKRESESTPRSSHPVQRLASPARLSMDSPTTPTAGSVAHAETHARGKHQAPPPTSYMYMQHSSQGTGSMPSLSSSISSASASSDRGRVLSLEGPGAAAEGRHPPSAWNAPHLAQAKASVSGSDTIASPYSSVWHSRSSTMDSIETTSSVGSTPSGKSHRRLPVLEHTIREGPTTPTHHRDDYNRDWRFPQTQRHVQYASAPRTRHESLNSQSSAYSASSTGHLPRSPFANLSLASPSEAGVVQGSEGQYTRPRAQTMTFYDRRIAPLPSHSIHAYTAAPTGEFGVDRRFFAPSPQRSFSSQSASSLPHRISAMDMEVEGPYPGATFASVPTRRLSTSSGHGAPGPTPGNTVIVSMNASASGGGSAKYECGWCGKRFSRPSSLKIHHHSHTGEKPFVCSEAGCGRTFSVQSNLRRHQKSHLAHVRRTAGGPPLEGEASLSRSGSFHLPQSTSMPLSNAHGGIGGITRVTSTSPKNQLQRFGSLRERKTSISSSAAADDEGEYGALEDTELDDDANSLNGGGGNRSMRSKRRFSYEQSETDEGEVTVNAADAMQDIREEAQSASASSSDERPPTAGSMQVRFQGLLNSGGVGTGRGTRAT